jgi:hypothetical protein
MPSAEVSGRISESETKRPQQDSNLRTRLRRPVLYPLSYGGSMTPKGYQSRGIGRDRPVSLRITLPNTVASPA